MARVSAVYLTKGFTERVVSIQCDKFAPGYDTKWRVPFLSRDNFIRLKQHLCGLVRHWLLGQSESKC